MFFEDINYVYPKVCGICGKRIFYNSYTCTNCLSILKCYRERMIFNPDNFCDFILSLFEYSGIIRRRICELKFREGKYIAKTFAELVSKRLVGLNMKFDVIIPVPISFKRYLERGYNQSEEIAKYVGIITHKKVLKKVLVKKKNNKRQSELNIKERTKNVLGVYKIRHSEKINNKRVLLIDDIYTTGATANECARVLKLFGAEKVLVLTIAYAKKGF